MSNRRLKNENQKDRRQWQKEVRDNLVLNGRFWLPLGLRKTEK